MFEFSFYNRVVLYRTNTKPFVEGSEQQELKGEK